MTAKEPRAGRVAFLTRKYPPSVGGMETLAHELFLGLQRAGFAPRLVALGRSQKHLLWWLPTAVVRVAALVARRQVDGVVCGDAITYLALRALLWRSRAPITTLTMGLDLTYPNPVYQALLRRALPRVDRLVAISEATAAQAARLGVPRERITVMRLGVSAPHVTDAQRAAAREAVCEATGVSPDHVLLLTLGRLVRRKGVLWFVEQVLPALPERAVYLVAGSGPDAEEIRQAVERSGAAARVRLLGLVDDDTREQLLSGCDAFVMPNIPVPGDMEGFGLVTVEAAQRGTLVVAAELEGIVDAVQRDVTGLLCPPADAAAWIAQLTALVSRPEELRALGAALAHGARELYSAEAMTSQLTAALGGCATPTG